MIRVIAASLLCLAGCESTPPPPLIPFASGGSAADGVIIMSATGDSSRGIAWMASEYMVLERCQAWDYSGFEAFDFVSSECVSSSTSTTMVCAGWTTTVPAQCIDYEPSVNQSCDVYQHNRNYQCTGPRRP